MIMFYCVDGSVWFFVVVELIDVCLDDIVWIDFYCLMCDEEMLVECLFGIVVLIWDEMKDIEFLSCFYFENGVIYMIVFVVWCVESEQLELVDVGFVFVKD